MRAPLTNQEEKALKLLQGSVIESNCFLLEAWGTPLQFDLEFRLQEQCPSCIQIENCRCAIIRYILSLVPILQIGLIWWCCCKASMTLYYARQRWRYPLFYFCLYLKHLPAMKLGTIEELPCFRWVPVNSPFTKTGSTASNAVNAATPKHNSCFPLPWYTMAVGWNYK